MPGPAAAAAPAIMKGAGSVMPMIKSSAGLSAAGATRGLTQPNLGGLANAPPSIFDIMEAGGDEGFGSNLLGQTLIGQHYLLPRIREILAPSSVKRARKMQERMAKEQLKLIQERRRGLKERRFRAKTARYAVEGLLGKREL